MENIEELKQAGFSDEEVYRYVNQKTSTLKAAGFSDRAIGDHFGFTETYANAQEQNSLLQRARNYLGISETPRRPTATKMPESMKGQIQTEYGPLYEKMIASDEADVEFQRVMAQGLSGLTGGVSELIGGRIERPQTLPGVIAGAGLELAGFIAGPFKAGKFLLGSRLAPTASGLSRMAQILAQGGAQLGIATGLSRIIPAFLEDTNFGNYAIDILSSTGMGALTGMIYPSMSVFPTKPLRIAMTLGIMDFIRAETSGMGISTIDDFISGIKDGTIDKKQMGQMAFGYLMDMYFASKTPSIRTYLKAIPNDMAREISKLDSDKVAQTILDIANTDAMDTKVKELQLNRAVQYEGRTYEAKGNEIHAEIVEKNGLPFDEKVIDGYTDKNGDFFTRDKVVGALREGEGLQPDNMRESIADGKGYQPDGGISGAESPLEMTLRYGPEKEMMQAVTDAMIGKGTVRDPNKLFSEQAREEVLSDRERYKPIAEKYGTTPEKWAAEFFVKEASSWGRKLGEIGLESQRLERKYPEFAEAMRELKDINKVPTLWEAIWHGWKSFDQIRRGLLVTQLSTSVRNFETQMGRVGLDVFEKGIDAGLQKLLGKEVTASPLDGIHQLVDILRRDNSKKIAELILKEFPKEYDRLYGSYMADIEPGQMGHTIGKGVDILNTVNRFQEFLVRNGVFKASLEQRLKLKGQDLIKIIEENQVGKIDIKDIEHSVNRSLEMTFAQTPVSHVGKALVNFVNNFPGASFIMPFPRFFVNSTKFVFEYNPTGFLKLLSSAERKAIANGDMHVLSRATLGTIMLGLAYLFRDSEYAGEKWYEIKAGDKIIDTRPFNPFASYLFMADVTHKLIHRNLERLTTKDIALGVFSANLRAGMGLYAMDQFFNAMSKTGDPQKALDYVKQAAGELVGGFLTPLNQVKEFLGGFDKYIVREKRSEPFWGPIKEKMPWLERTLPELYSPTHEGPVVREVPALRQLTGLAISTKNSFEKELDRLGFQYSEVFHSTGNPEADNLIKKNMGTLSKEVMDPLVSSPDFMAMGDAQKGYVISGILNGIREAGKEIAQGEKPELFFKVFFDHIPKREKAMLEETGVNLKTLEKQLTEPTKGEVK